MCQLNRILFKRILLSEKFNFKRILYFPIWNKPFNLHSSCLRHLSRYLVGIFFTKIFISYLGYTIMEWCDNNISFLTNFLCMVIFQCVKKWFATILCKFFYNYTSVYINIFLKIILIQAKWRENWDKYNVLSLNIRWLFCF